MQSYTAVVLGATGLIGELLVQQLIDDADCSKVRILVRRPVQISHAKLETVITDFSNLTEFRNNVGEGDCLFCCIGTTMKQVKGDKTLYRTIDFDIPVNAAQFAKDAGFEKYLLVSAVGANARSSNFYLRLKGEVEEKIASINFNSFHVFRPSMLLGKRKEVRIAENIAKAIFPLLSFVMVGPIKKYRGINAGVIAKAMVSAAKDTKTAMIIHHYDDIMYLANT